MASRRQQILKRDRRLCKPVVEPLELRFLLSTTAFTSQVAEPCHGSVTPVISELADAIPADGGGAIAPFTPAQIRHFYSLDNVSLNRIAGNGAGETIAIVDAYNQPDMLDSTDPNFDTSDLHLFDQRFGLPDPPSFTKVDEFGGTDLPTTYNSGWAIEISLDVEWAHAMAPAANIALVECYSASYDDLLTFGAATAAQMANVVSMSFVGSEFDGDSAYDSVFTQPGVTYLAAAGDQGSSSTGYPAFSPNVVAVGGTEITTSDAEGGYGSEAVWNDQYGATGGGVSSYTPQPGYQSNIAIGDGNRVVPDVAFDAAPSTGVYVLDSSVSTSGDLYLVGGTSLSCPCWAGIIAVADQARSLIGLSSLGGINQTLPRLYQLPATDFNDITEGDNDGYSAAIGYDATTGLGTPIAPSLITDLAGGDTIAGRVFMDHNSDGTPDGPDTPVVDQTVYLDLNNNGIEDPGEPTAVTNSSGDYTFTDQPGGETGTVRLASNAAGLVVVSGNSTFTTSYGSTQNLMTGLLPTKFTDTVGGAVFSISLDSTGSTLQISINGTVEYSAPASLISSLTFDLTGTGDSLKIDGSNGDPVPAGGLSLHGASSGDQLTVIGTATGNDAFTVTSSSIAFGSNSITFSNVSNLLLNPGTGNDSLAVNSGSVTIAAQLAGAGILTRTFSSLTLGSDASVTFAKAASHSDRTLAVVSTLSIGTDAMLDLGGNDMIVQNGNLSAITALLATGFNNGYWNGTGIDSSAAASTIGTALGSSDNLQSVFGPSNLFDGYAPAAADVIIKYTVYGDANLDGQLDGSDYTKIDNGYNTRLTGWQNGDFNYDSVVDASDYTLIDNAFNSL